MTERLGASVKEAAEAFGVSPGTIYAELRKPGCKIPVVEFGDLKQKRRPDWHRKAAQKEK
jgi:transposase